jgi:hypothetical protein
MRFFSTVFIFLYLIIFSCSSLFALDFKDGYKGNKRLKSNFFTVYFESDQALNNFEFAIDVPYNIRALTLEPTVLYETGDVAGELDILYLAVSAILDIELSKYSCKIKVCDDAESLSRISNRLFGRTIDVPAFYVLENNTIYVDARDVNINILGHELAHAIQNEYFVVPPPQKIQEVLAGYVEYQLRKSVI